MLPGGLLADIENYLDITWTDEATDKKITGIAERGIMFLDKKAGVILDYTQEAIHRDLLFEYCKYTRNGLLHEFIINYTPFLEDLRAGNGGAYGEETTTV